MKKLFLFLFSCMATELMISGCSTANQLAISPDTKLLTRIDEAISGSADQYLLLMRNVPQDKFPKNYAPQKKLFESSNSSWWCSGFYPGTLLNLFEETHSQPLYDEAMRKLTLLEKEKTNTGTHDLGFMMYCSFGTANRIAPKPEYKAILLASARSLATRFNPVVGCIKSWDSRPSDYLVIIDNMMNLELLFWATRQTGDSSFYKIAVTHADHTILNHFRADYSSYHVVNYDAVTGAVQQKRTAQGAADESAWARGQAWGLYGFTLVYRETKDRKYLEQAKGIADFILGHPHLPNDKIPYWDFNAPGIPDAERDVSAGAIMASALLELSGYVNGAEKKKYFTAAETILTALLSPQYQSLPNANDGFLLQHSVGNKPQGTEVDVSLTYADYYFVEAMKRYKALKK